MPQIKTVLQKAVVVEDLTRSRKDNGSQQDIDFKVVDRIQKCLNLAEDGNTTEAEAKAAMRMASRLMSQFNLSRADLIAAQAASGESSTLTGETHVQISHPSPDRHVKEETWTHHLVKAMTTEFDCKSYSTKYRPRRIRWTFYGISENAYAAALAFEMCHNLIQEWSLSRLQKGNRNSYRLGVASGLRAAVKKAKRELEHMAQEEAEKALADREQEERNLREREIRRLEHPELGNIQTDGKMSRLDSPEADANQEKERKTPRSSEEADFGNSFGGDGEEVDWKKVKTQSDGQLSDDEDETGIEDGFADFDASNDRPINLHTDLHNDLQWHMPGPAASHDRRATAAGLTRYDGDEDRTQRYQDMESGLLHHQAGALVKLSRSAKDLAEQYLQAKNMKLRHRRKRDWEIRDRGAYDQGKKDSKDIDLKRRRIGDVPIEQKRKTAVKVKQENEADR